MLDQPVVKIIPMRMREDFLRDLDESKSRKTPQSIKPTTEGVCLRRNGSEFPAEISHSSWEAGGCHYCCAMVRDISHRRDVEQRLRQREVELAHIGRLHVAGELATGLAHELNQPLHSISNFVRGALLRLEKGNTEEEDIKAALRQMVAETKRAFQIISRLRMLVRKRVAGVRVEVDINELVNEVLPLFDARVRSMGVVLTRQLAEPLPSVNADPVQISQVIVNLLQNALDAMASVPTNHRRLTVATERRGHEVAVLICDSGEGVSAEVVKQMFVPFYTTKSDGLGIGLSLSRSIVESHTGRIWSKPNSPCGTAVCFALPVREGEKDHGK